MCIETVVGPIHHSSVEGWGPTTTTSVCLCDVALYLDILSRIWMIRNKLKINDAKTEFLII